MNQPTDWPSGNINETPQQTKKNNYKKKLASINIPSLIKTPQVKILQRKSKKSPAPIPRRGNIGSELSFGSMNFNPSPNPGIEISSDRFRTDKNLLSSMRNNKNPIFDLNVSRPSFPNNQDMNSFTRVMTSFGEYPSFQGDLTHQVSFGNLLNLQSMDNRDRPDFSMHTSIKNPVFTPGTSLMSNLKFSFQNQSRDPGAEKMFENALSQLQESPNIPALNSEFGNQTALSLKDPTNPNQGKESKQMFVSNIVHNQNIYINQNAKTPNPIVSSSKLAGINIPTASKRKGFYNNDALVTSSLTPPTNIFAKNKVNKQPVSKFISNTKTSNLDKRSHLMFQNQSIPKRDLIDGPGSIIVPQRINHINSIRHKKNKKSRNQSIISSNFDGVEPELKLEVKLCLAKPCQAAMKYFVTEFRKFEQNLEKKEIYVQRAHYESKHGKAYIVNPDMEKITSAGFSLTSNAMAKSVIDRTNSLHPTVFDQAFYDSTLKDEEGCQDIIRNTFLFKQRDKNPVIYRKIVTAILSLRSDIFDNLKQAKSMSGAEHFMKYFNLQVPIKQQYFSSLKLKDRAKLMCFFFCKFFNRNKLLGLFGQFWPEIKIHHEYKTHQKM